MREKREERGRERCIYKDVTMCTYHMYMHTQHMICKHNSSVSAQTQTGAVQWHSTLGEGGTDTLHLCMSMHVASGFYICISLNICIFNIYRCSIYMYNIDR